MQRTLVAFDTDKIKGYVFGTDKLKEIRGASSILDSLNRNDMVDLAKAIDPDCEVIYANGGSGLFCVHTDEETAKKFALDVKRAYAEQTRGGSSITYVTQSVLDNAPQDEDEFMKHPLEETLKLLRYKMRESKDCAPTQIALPSHPFMRTCEACGINYAEQPRPDTDGAPHYCCASCSAKQKEDEKIKGKILNATRKHKKILEELPKEDAMKETLWERIIYQLKVEGYDFSIDGDEITKEKVPQRPEDFNIFREFGKSKEYLGLIYADGNNMGAAIEDLKKLNEIKKFSLDIDSAIHQAMGKAIAKHLPVIPANPLVPGDTPHFPFDILLLGGDDLVLVTSATKALDVALTIAQEFRQASGKEGEKHYSLSVGVVLAPVKYPFSQLQELAEQTLKATKQASAQVRSEAKKRQEEDVDDTRISFLVAAGGSVQSYKRMVGELEKGKHPENPGEREFHATMRPYAPDTLETLLKAIGTAHTIGVNRTKLHQMREAIFKMNLTTSVSESRGIIRNWQAKQYEHVIKVLYKIGLENQVKQQVEQDLFADFPRIIFPWVSDGKNDYDNEIYRTSILDFIELYDFVDREE